MPNQTKPGKSSDFVFVFKRPQVRTLLERLWLQRTPAETTDTFCLHVASLKAITTQILSTFLGAYTWTLWQKYFRNRILIVIPMKKYLTVWYSLWCMPGSAVLWSAKQTKLSTCRTGEHTPEMKPNSHNLSFEYSKDLNIFEI